MWREHNVQLNKLQRTNWVSHENIQCQYHLDITLENSWKREDEKEVKQTTRYLEYINVNPKDNLKKHAGLMW